MIIALQTLVFFRESLFAVIDRLFRPYYKHFSLTFNRHVSTSDDDESEDHVFAEFDDEKGVVFFPPMYAQRYAAVSDCLMDERWCGKLEKVVDFGYHDMSFIKYLKDVPGVTNILGVDLECIPLRCSSDLFGGDDYAPKRENPLQVTLYQGNAADPDYRLIGCDAVIAIEMIEHMLPHDLERFVHTVFGFVRPWIAIITTPNGDFNPLFKSLEKNGLRRLDHFFEWSREQFHDWCSNIVVRYPQYTVSCRGVGPGPQGTLHYGCCSQLALFVSKDYHKQLDLNFNSLALVPRRPNPDVCDMIGSIGSLEALNESNNMLCTPNTIESYTELVFSDKQSCVTIVLSPSFSVNPLECRDETAQCNLDTELGKNFLFDEEPCFGVLVPRRKSDNRVYMMEDINSRLNCTTLQVKKFSKTTQNMLAKNKIDSLMHTREVVDEIKHLTKMLNFKNETKDDMGGSQIWNNINWGDNAPYWNQYYTVVREYNYPFEVKSEECRILDLISDEINRLIDTQFDEEFVVEANKFEIPIDHLMKVVQHITTDVNRVKDLLDWNGYEIAGDVVIYSRLAIDNASVGSQDDEWKENDTLSDWDTDVRSTSFSDGSTIVPDYNALPSRCLHRALDRKVRKLRSMLSADEDITTELDRVVCKLTKLALRATRRRQSPLPMKWMQCKMLDLLNLTEKAIEKKKKRVELYPLKAICYDERSPVREELHLSRIKENEITNEIVRKYRHLVRPSDNTNTSEDMQKYQYNNGPGDGDLSNESSVEFLKDRIVSELNFEEILRSPSLMDIEPVPDHPIKPRKVSYIKSDTPISRTQAWVEEDINVVRYPAQSTQRISSGDTDHSMSNMTCLKIKKSHKKQKPSAEDKEANLNIKRRKKSATKTSYEKHKTKNVDKSKNKDKSSKTRIIKNAVKKNSSYNILVKTCSKKLTSADFGNIAVKSKRNVMQNLPRPSASKPIPEILMGTVHMDTDVDQKARDVDVLKSDNIPYVDSIGEVNMESNIATTKESILIDIVMEDKEETIALRRTIGTDEPIRFEQETILGSMTNVMKADSFYNKQETENVHSKTIFIYDINEPSTSKGVQHLSMDVQCGPDATNNISAMLSATTSFTKLPKIFNAGIKIGDSKPNIYHTEKRCTEFGTSTNDCSNAYKTITPRLRSFGIRIRDSDSMIKERVESGTMTFDDETSPPVSSIPHSFDSAIETQLLKPVSSRIKMEDSGSEFCESVGSFLKGPLPFASSKDTCEFQIKSSVSKDVGIEKKNLNNYIRPKLCCGGVHVHSYKDRQTSEDVVYQGEWQRYRPKPSKRKPIISVVAKKANESACKKLKASIKEKKDNVVVDKDVKLQEFTTNSKRLPIRNANLKKIIRDDASKRYEDKTMAPPKTQKTVQFNRNVTKISTKLVASSVSTKPNKLSYVTKKQSVTSITSTLKKEGHKAQKCCKKSYLPLYLKRKLAIKNQENQETESTETITGNKEKPIVQIPVVIESIINKENKKALLDNIDSIDFDFEPRENISYVIFRNEIETNKSTPEPENSLPPRETYRRRDNPVRRSPSPQSQNSSACSSSNSIATVRARSLSKNMPDRRFPTSSNKSNLSNIQSENAPCKNKKFTKRAKTSKKSQDKEHDNKENVPESSSRSKESMKSAKTAFMRKKNVFRAHVTTECSPQTAPNLSRVRPQTANKSNIRIPTVPCTSAIKLPTTSTSSKPLLSKKSSPKSQTSLRSINKSEINLTKQGVPPVISQTENQQNKSSEKVNMNIVDNDLLAEWMNSTYKNVIDTHTSNILAAMRQLVEERLDFIERIPDNCIEVDSETVILSKDKLESLSVSASTSFHDSTSLDNSFGTAIAKENEEVEDLVDINVIQNIVNNTLHSVLGNESIVSLANTAPSDLDLLSFKSLTSASKLSEYFLAESSLNNITESVQNTGNPVTGSLRDIFERKKQLTVQNAGALAMQAFSGFSMNVEPVAGDQPDRINIVDSETGSMAHGTYSRQATSEEVFISGRSSSSYESCLLGDDTVVPYWLFQIISQQQSVDEEEDEADALLPMPVPLAEPMFDVNGNVMEPGMGAGAGAGDGRGIHSDQSQDSSGRGTSLSSSGTSSGPHSEAILFDPSAFTTNFDQMREPISSNALVPLPFDSPETSYRTAEETVRTNDIINSSGEGGDRTTVSFMAASDVDADISSIDTDAPDSSDN